MGYMAARAVFVTHQSQECMGVLTNTTIVKRKVMQYNKKILTNSIYVYLEKKVC